jgi:two-component system phosphate regulon sensor histidine kinase PhoR
MRPRGSIITRLLIAFSVFAVLIAIAAVFIYVGAGRQDRASKELTGRDYVLQQAAGQMSENFTASQLAVSGFALTGRPAVLRPLASARVSFSAELAILRRHAPAAQRGFVAAQGRAGARLFAVAGQITRLRPASPSARRLASGTASIAGSFYAANSAMQERLAADIRRLTADSGHYLRVALAWSAAALAIAVTLVLAASLGTVRSITAPLRGLTATVGRLTSGDRAARVKVAGAAEVRAAAKSVNAMADESDRLRQQEQENARLRAMAREAGIRVRAHLRAEDVLREACAAIAQCVDSDLAALRLVEEEKPRYAESVPKGWLPVSFLRELSPDFDSWAHGLLKNQSSTVIQDVPGPDGDQLPPAIREPLLRQGVTSHLGTPFGIGAELFGVIELERVRPGHPWTVAEIDAVQSIAADLGRGLKQARLYEAENRLVAQLTALDQTKSDFFATVSHELRTPLASIEGYVELLRDEDGGQISAKAEWMLETIDRNATRLRNLIEDLFTLSKIESGAFQTVLRPVSLPEIARDAAQAMRPVVARTEVTLAVQCPDERLIVNGDVSQLERLVMNLLSNAAKFTPPGGRIRLTAARDGGAAVISVSDTGIGIPEQDRAALFSRFFRASNAVEAAIPGTGLGLTIVGTVVSNHGGELDLQSTVGVGTTVSVRLPLL